MTSQICFSGDHTCRLPLRLTTNVLMNAEWMRLKVAVSSSMKNAISAWIVLMTAQSLFHRSDLFSLETRPKST